MPEPRPAVEPQPAPDVGAAGAGRVIVVCSPKGGSGKTVVATNLAVGLNDLGHRVCLVDLDLEFGDVAISLGLEPQRSLIDAVTADLPDDVADPIDFLAVRYRPGVDCILAPIDPHAVDRIPVGLVTDLLSLLAASYDAIVVDTGTHLPGHVLAAVDVADVLVLVARPEIPTLKNMRLFIDALDARGQTGAVRLLVSNTAGAPGAVPSSSIQEALGMPVLTELAASADVVESLNIGRPLAVTDPRHPVSQAIRGLAAEVLPAPVIESFEPARRTPPRHLRHTLGARLLQPNRLSLRSSS